jgi:hypothetical protein
MGGVPAPALWCPGGPKPPPLRVMGKANRHLGGDGGNGDDREDCKAPFKVGWPRIRAGLTDDDIAKALRCGGRFHCGEGAVKLWVMLPFEVVAFDPYASTLQGLS